MENKKTNQKSKLYKYGRVSYYRDGNKWQCYYSDPVTKKQVWRALDASTQRMAELKAKEKNEALESGTLSQLETF